MGCEYPSIFEENELNTEKSEKNQIIPIPENEIIETETTSNSIPPELNRSIKIKFNKLSLVPIKYFPISDEEFNSILNRNIVAEKLLKLYKPQIDGIEYETDVKYKNINPIKILDPEGGSQYYKGGFNTQGQCHGRGIWIKDYSVYIGNFRNDEFYGTGLFINDQGDYYFGHWKNSLCNGPGVLLEDQKLVYQGDFRNCKKEGYGEETYQDGDVYKGAFYDGEKNGKGQYIFADGSRYDGNFKNSKYNGFGQITLKGGNSIRGEFKEGKLNGEGDITWNDGTKFVGNFIDDIKSGEGTYVWNDGRSYKGFWNGNMVSGSGLLKDPNRGTQESITLD